VKRACSGTDYNREQVSRRRQNRDDGAVYIGCI
jgi:hypothetical protein